MKTSWHVRRTVVARSDGQRRWDDVSQFLLQWAMEHEAGSCPAPSHHQEDHHGSCPLCPGLHHPTTTHADD